jgi:diguanylate cyclase (GGDEF)-like protein/PAS domain S-box-containing protein
MSASVGAMRLFAKLILVIAPCFLAVAFAGLMWLVEIDQREAEAALALRIGNAAARIDGALGRLREEEEITVAHQQALLSLLLADQAVRCVEVVTGGEVTMALPRGRGCAGEAIDDSLALPLTGAGDETLRVHFSKKEVLAAKRSRRDLSLLVLYLGLFIAIISSFVGFRLIIGQRLQCLLQAIRQSRETGLPTRIETDSRDELGVVIGAFNDMQAHLDAEAVAVRRALDRLHRVYNTTPALLCSCDLDGTLTSVSDYWVRTMGYAREEAIGRPIEALLESTSVPVWRDRVIALVAEEQPVQDVPLRLDAKDQRQIDVLLAAVPDTDAEGRITLLCVMTDISQMKLAERRLQKLALTDPLTSLPNRRGLIEHLGRVIHREAANSDRSITAVLFIDLDNFKWINDTYGHEAGDALLVEVGERLRRCVRVNDLIARQGGDEFAVVCHRLDASESAEQVAERIIEQLSAPFEHGGSQGFVNASIGIAYLEPGMEGPDSILRLADLAMYQAKQNGKGCFRTYTPELGQKALATATLCDQIHQGLEQNGFSLMFQPIIDLASETPVGAEALLRLNSPTAGMIPPDDFVPVAEETGLIHELGAWVLEHGVQSLAELDRAADGTSFYVTLNLSTHQLDEKLVDRLEAAFERHPEARGRIVLEITETALLQRGDKVGRLLDGVRGTGVRIALDDFGTGYSSLSHVHEFPGRRQIPCWSG